MHINWFEGVRQTKQHASVGADAVEFDPLTHIPDFGSKRMLRVKSLILISQHQTYVEMYLFLEALVFID